MLVLAIVPVPFLLFFLCHSRLSFLFPFPFCHSRAGGNPGVNRKTNNIQISILKIKKGKYYYTYILASKRNGTLYIGVTNNLFSRTSQHKLKQDSDSFTAKYNINKLVYHEEHQYVQDAILREKQLKKWNRQWKINLIEKENSTWRDLNKDFG